MEIEKRAEEKFLAYEMYQKGKSLRQICKDLNRNYRTVRKYVDEMEALASQDFDPAKVKAKVQAETLALIQHCKMRLNDPDLHATSTAGPYWARTLLDGLYKLAKMHGVEDPRQQAEVDTLTSIADMARALAKESPNLNDGLTPGEYVFDGYTPVGILAKNGKDVVDEDTGEVVGTLDDSVFVQDAVVVEEG